MRSHKKFYTSKGSNQVGLYSFVFTKRISLFVVCFLFVSFFVQPFHQAFANEAAAEPEQANVIPDEVVAQLPSPAKSEKTQEQVSTNTSQGVIENQNQVDGQSSNTPPTVSTINATNNTTQTSSGVSQNSATTTTTNTTNSTSGTSNSGTKASTTTTTNPNGNSVTSSTTTSAPTSTSSSQTSGGSSSASSTNNISATSTGNGTSNTSTSTPNTNTGSTTTTSDDTDSGVEQNDTQNPDNPVPPDTTGGNDGDSTDNTGSSTNDDLIDNKKIKDGVNGLVDEVVNEVVNLTRQLVTEENYYQFSRQSCVPVGDGTYHCSTKTDGPFDTGNAIYAERDSQGDTEIYMRTAKGEIKQLTDNDFDDSSPDIHLASMQAVWQRLIDGRYQIISYDLNTREETQLTFSRNNSMEPKISAEGVVWQAWDGNDWEIMFFDGQFTDQITSNEVQDVTPVIEDGYILWSVLGGKKAEARVYSLESQEMLSIQGHEGGSIANPRFVLVYDTKFDNGDVITQGFDPVTGLAQPLAAKPADLPFNLPEPDPVGEIRALIQNKSVHDENEIVIVPSGDTDGDLNLASTTATSTGTLLVDAAPDDTVSDNGTTTEPVFELDEYDLVITDTASSTNSDINHTELSPEALKAIATSTSAIVVNTAPTSSQP